MSYPLNSRIRRAGQRPGSISWLAFATAALAATGFSFSTADGAPRISEFLAASGIEFVNDARYVDEDGQPSDWIEVLNPDAAPVSLDGWYLTDDAANLTKWRIPAVTLAAGERVVIYASNKDRTNPAGQLHTNFELAKDGEFLALVRPDGTSIASQFAPMYPQQYDGISYGNGTAGAVTRETFVATDAPVRYHIPLDDSLGTTWRNAPSEFDDSSWTAAQAGVGFETVGGTLEPLVKTDISADMRGLNASGYFRFPFTYNATDKQVQSLILRVRIDDGFAAFLNGVEVASLFAPSPLAFNSASTNSRSDSIVLTDTVPTDPDITSFHTALKNGANVLAIQAMNSSAGGSDFVLEAELIADVLDTSGGSQLGYFEEPTPGLPNDVVKTTPPAEVVFSATSGIFTADFDLTLSTTTPGAVIRYTTDLSLPSNSIDNPSPEYTGPIRVSSSTQVRARAFLPGALDGAARTETFLKASGNVPGFSSDLPVVVVSTLGTGAPPESGSTTRKPAFIGFYEPDPVTGRTTLAGSPELYTRGGIRKRGSSSSGWPKYAMSVETWKDAGFDANGDGNISIEEELDNNIEPLGFPREADWILSARYEFDRALMRNEFIYALSNQLGRYAVRTRFVEVYNDVNGGDLSDADYFGVYSLMERIEMDENRVDIPAIQPWENSEPEITGGYVFKKDRSDPGEPTFNVSGMGTMVHVDPDGNTITSQQRNWLVGYLNEMDRALNAADGVNPTTGKHFSEYLDVDAWIDHHWLNTLAMNVDWGRLSAFYHKDRGGMAIAGPIWDFDRTMGSEDGRDANPRRWDGTGDSSMTWFDSRYPWFGKLLGFNNALGPDRSPSTRPDIYQRHADRWFELRRNEFSTANINAIIDGMAAEIEEAQVRNFQKWSQRPPNGGQFAGGLRGWEGEVAQLKGWLQARMEWIDSQYVQAPAFNVAGGVVPSGFEMILSSANGEPVYYTFDGSDPRAPGGEPAEGASQFVGGAADTVYVTSDAIGRFFVPTDDSLGTTWTQVDFNDAAWMQVNNGIGWETIGGTLEPEIKTNTESQMRTINASGYVRFTFDYGQTPTAINSAVLRVKYDDGFAAFLNGELIASANSPVPPAWNSEATTSNADTSAILFEAFDISAHIGKFRQGKNVLALQTMNTTASGSDLLLAAELEVNEAVGVQPVPLTQSTLVTARTFDGTEWSAPAEAYFIVGEEPASNQNLVISEIMYHPLPPTGEEFAAGFLDQDEFEFLEVLNIGSQTVNVFEASFTAGFDFDFRDGDISALAPGARAVIVKNRAAFEKRYGPGLPVAGEYPNDQLSNGGETIRLRDRLQVPIRDFRYEDGPPWPASADGDGFSLVLRNPGLNPDHGDPANWSAGLVVHGTPGTGEPTDSAFAQWMIANGLSGPLEDKDNDGSQEIVEFVTNTDPNNPSSNLASTGYGGSRETVNVGNGSDEYFVFRFTLLNDAGGVTAIPEASYDGATWFTGPEHLVLVSNGDNGDGTTTFLYRSAKPITEVPTVLMRLNVQVAL